MVSQHSIPTKHKSSTRGVHRILLSLFLTAILLFSTVLTSSVRASPAFHVKIFGRGCFSCFVEYAKQVEAATKGLIGNTTIEVHYLESDYEAVREVEQLYNDLKVPEELRSNVIVCINGRFLFEGYVPTNIIVDFMMYHISDFESVVVLRDELTASYKILDATGLARQCDLKTSIDECFEISKSSNPLLLVIVSGLLDGINPCAFAVLLFFIAVVLRTTTSQKRDPKKRLLRVGLVYITAIYLAYLAIGLTFMKVIQTTPFSHIVAKAGATVMILLGIIDINDYFLPGRGPSLGISPSRWEVIRTRMHSMSLPAIFFVGLMVGLFEFPCTGGIYMGILGLLSLRLTLVQGIFYLIIYNLAFILPLIVILVLPFSMNMTRFSLTRWKMREHRAMKMISGVVMIALGLFLLYIELV